MLWGNTPTGRNMMDEQITVKEMCEILDWLGNSAKEFTGWTNHLILRGLATRLKNGDEDVREVLGYIRNP